MNMIFKKGVTEIFTFHSNYKFPLQSPHTIKMIWFSFRISFKQTNKTEREVHCLGLQRGASVRVQTLPGSCSEATFMCMMVVFSATVQVLVHQV